MEKLPKQQKGKAFELHLHVAIPIGVNSMDAPEVPLIGPCNAETKTFALVLVGSSDGFPIVQSMLIGKQRYVMVENKGKVRAWSCEEL